MKYLWDTNTVIYFMKKEFPLSAEKFIDSTFIDSIPTLSVISEIELLCWTEPIETELQEIQNFITDAEVIELIDKIKSKTIELKKNNRIKLPDAIIAATALVYDLTLISRNAKDFKNIPTLKFINPFDLK